MFFQYHQCSVPFGNGIGISVPRSIVGFGGGGILVPASVPAAMVPAVPVSMLASVPAFMVPVVAPFFSGPLGNAIGGSHPAGIAGIAIALTTSVLASVPAAMVPAMAPVSVPASVPASVRCRRGGGGSNGGGRRRHGASVKLGAGVGAGVGAAAAHSAAFALTAAARFPADFHSNPWRPGGGGSRGGRG